MTHADPNDPNDLRLPPKRSYEERTDSNTSMWVAAALAMLVIVGVLIYAMSGTGRQTASFPPAPTTGAGPTTAGTERPSQPVTPLPNPRAPAAPASNQ